MTDYTLLKGELSSFLENPTYTEKYQLIRKLIQRCDDPEYPKHKLIQDLENNGFRFFANKVRTGYYDQEVETPTTE